MAEWVISNLPKELQSIASNIDAVKNGGNNDKKISGNEVEAFKDSVWNAYQNGKITADVAKVVCDAAKVDEVEEKRNPSLWTRIKNTGSNVMTTIVTNCKETVTDIQAYYWVRKEAKMAGNTPDIAWRYYNSLGPEDKQHFLEKAKRNVGDELPRSFTYDKEGYLVESW